MKPKVSDFLVFFGAGISIYFVEALYVCFFIITYIMVKLFIYIEKQKAIAEKEKAVARVIAEKDTVIAEKEKAIAEKDTVIAEKDTVIATVIAEKDTVVAEIKERNFSFLDATPNIVYNGVSRVSTASKTKSNYLCDFTPVAIEWEFQVRDFQRPKRPSLWDVVESCNGHFHNEAVFARLVTALLLDVINATPFFSLPQNYVDIIPETAVGGRFPDALVLKKPGDIPFFVVEVKKPGIFRVRKNQTYIKLIYGQMYDYLSSVRTEYGVCNPYGMLTTFNEFQICWLSDSLNHRTLNVSDVVWKIDSNHSTSLQALAVIASALIEGFNSQMNSPIHGSQITTSRKIFLEESMAWGKLEIPLLFDFPHKFTARWFVKTTFEQGADGKAFHVFNHRGSQAVLKFVLRNQHRFRMDDYLRNRNELEADAAKIENDERKLLEQERKYWVDINRITLPRIVRANKKWALLMPYLEPLTMNEKRKFLEEDSDIFQQISSIFDICVEQGLYQTDASWRHVGWFKYGATPVIKLLDFGHIEEYDRNDEDKKREAKNAMLSELERELDFERPRRDSQRLVSVE